MFESFALWTPLILPLSLALAWIILPGYALNRVLGLQRDLSLLLSPAVSIFLIVVAAYLATVFNVAWGWGFALLFIAAVILSALALVFFTARGQVFKQNLQTGAKTTTAKRAKKLGLLSSLGASTYLGLALSFVILMLGSMWIIRNPFALSQTWDAAFHLNALRFIFESGEASVFHVSQIVTAPESYSFYPAAWHAITSLLVLPGAEVSAVTLLANASSMAIISFIWPASLAFFLRVYLPARISRFAVLVLPAFSASSIAFPYLFFSYGVLYPNLLSYALMPALVGLWGLLLFKLDATLHPIDFPLWVLLLLGAITSVATVAAHPSGFTATLIAAVALGAGLTLNTMLSAAFNFKTLFQSREFLVRLGMSLATFALTKILWEYLDTGFGHLWKAVNSNLTYSYGQAFFNSVLSHYPSLVLTAFVLLGICFLFEARLFHLFFMWITFTVFYVEAMTNTDMEFRAYLLGSWYGDPHRLAALLAFAALPLAIAGAAYLISHLPVINKYLETSLSSLVIVALAFAGGVFFQLDKTMSLAMYEWQQSYKVDNEANAISPNELRLIEELPDLVGDSAVFANPWNGEVFVYALTGIDTSRLHVTAYSSPNESYLDANLNRIKEDPEVCRILREEEVEYVLLFLGDSINGHNSDRPAGVKNLFFNDGFEIVQQYGSAVLFKVKACS